MAATTLLARQPICDLNKEIVAYELLYRFEDGTINSSVDGNKATAQVLINTFSLGECEHITGGLPAFVNFTDHLLDFLPPIAPELLNIEILEDIDITPELLSKVQEIKSKGYKIVIDDFIWDDKYKPLLEMTDIVKLEVPAMNRRELKETITKLRKYQVELLAEKIETQEEYLFCKELGCTLFQGFFLYRPNIVKGATLSSNKMSVLKLITELNQSDADVRSISTIITQDSDLSYKLLSLINSAEFKRSVEISNINTAVSLLGLTRLRSWASMLAMAKLDDKPKSLLMISLQRAIFCENVAAIFSPHLAEKFYMIGMLSCLDLFFDVSINQLMQKLPLDDESKAALTEYQGLLGLILKTATLYEKFKILDVPWRQLRELGLNQNEVNTIFIDSNVKANALLESIY